MKMNPNCLSDKTTKCEAGDKKSRLGKGVIKSGYWKGFLEANVINLPRNKIACVSRQGNPFLCRWCGEHDNGPCGSAVPSLRGHWMVFCPFGHIGRHGSALTLPEVDISSKVSLAFRVLLFVCSTVTTCTGNREFQGVCHCEQLEKWNCDLTLCGHKSSFLTELCIPRAPYMEGRSERGRKVEKCAELIFLGLKFLMHEMSLDHTLANASWN